MNIKEIVEEYLKTNGFDGLCYSNECSCSLEDLMPCGQPNEIECMPGYSYTKEEFKKLSSEGYYAIDIDDYDFVICTRKPDDK